MPLLLLNSAITLTPAMHPVLQVIRASKDLEYILEAYLGKTSATGDACQPLRSALFCCMLRHPACAAAAGLVLLSTGTTLRCFTFACRRPRQGSAREVYERPTLGTKGGVLRPLNGLLPCA